MLGTIVNAIAIIVGGTIGVFFRSGISERFKETIMQGLGLSVLLIGLNMSLKTHNELIVILSLVIGGLLGEALDINQALENFGEKLQKLVNTKEGDFVKGFVMASLVYCIGAMAIMGALESGLTGQHKILFAKSTIDGISAVIFSSTMGVGVAFSALSVFIYQATITLLANSIKPFLVDQIIWEMTATGGLLIIGISLNVLGIKQIKVANLLPGILISAIITYVVINNFPQLYS